MLFQENYLLENGYAIFADLEHIVNYLESPLYRERFSLLRDEVGYPERFLTYLAN